MGMSSTLSQLAADGRQLRRSLKDVLGKSSAKKRLRDYLNSAQEAEDVIFRMCRFQKKRFEEHGLPFSGRDAANFIDWAVTRPDVSRWDLRSFAHCEWRLVEKYMDERWGTLRQPPNPSPLTDDEIQAF